MESASTRAGAATNDTGEGCQGKPLPRPSPVVSDI
jgi:hypothetical protein